MVVGSYWFSLVLLCLLVDLNWLMFGCGLFGVFVFIWSWTFGFSLLLLVCLLFVWIADLRVSGWVWLCLFYNWFGCCFGLVLICFGLLGWLFLGYVGLFMFIVAVVLFVWCWWVCLLGGGFVTLLLLRVGLFVAFSFVILLFRLFAVGWFGVILVSFDLIVFYVWIMVWIWIA